MKVSVFATFMASAVALCVVTLPAWGAGSVQGIVDGPAGKPLVGASVTLAETGQTSRTNPVGRYYLTDVAPGRATVVAAKEGYFPVLASIRVRGEGITERGFALKVDASQPVKKPVPAPPAAIKPPQWQPPVVTQSGAVENGFQITAKSDKVTYLPGELVVVTASIKNVTTKDLTLADTDWESDFEFDVTWHGAEAPVTKYGDQSHQKWIELQQLQRSDYGRGAGLLLRTLHPGEEKVYQFVVSRFQDMTLDGPYVIVVKRETDSSVQLVADPLRVVVADPNAVGGQ